MIFVDVVTVEICVATAETIRNRPGFKGAVGVVYSTMLDGSDSSPAVFFAVRTKNQVPGSGNSMVAVVTRPRGLTCVHAAGSFEKKSRYPARSVSVLAFQANVTELKLVSAALVNVSPAK